jgi:VIT1/CCC1 family predicted Fe2+/Mn2+ transporter
VLITVLVQATSDADETTFSVPILVGAAALAVGWLLLLAAVTAWRRPRGVRSGPPTRDLPPVPPAVAGLLCNDFELPAELPPATLLDLTARRVVRLEETAPGKSICRLRGTAADQPLSPYEQRVLDEVRRKAVDGVVPTDALTTGREDASSGWHRAFGREVVDDAQERGLTRNRWSRWVITLITVGASAIGGLLYLASEVGGESNDYPVASTIAGGIAFAGIVVLVVAAGRVARSLAQLPTDAGKETTARCLALRAHLRENEQLADLLPAAVQLWGRHFAYAGVMGVAPTAMALLPFGAEDDNGAWSRFGGRWRRVRVRYPRGWPPGWGKHPAFAAFLAVLWGAAAVAALYGLTRLAESAAEPITATDPLLDRDQLDWIGRGALLLTIPAALVLRGRSSFWCAPFPTSGAPGRRPASWCGCAGGVRSSSPATATTRSTGTTSRSTTGRVPGSDRGESGATSTTRTLRAQSVEAVYSPNLGYVREMRAPSAAGTGAAT